MYPSSPTVASLSHCLPPAAQAAHKNWARSVLIIWMPSFYSFQAKTGARLSRNGDNLHFCQDGLKAQIQMAQNTALKLNSYIMEI